MTQNSWHSQYRQWIVYLPKIITIGMQLCLTASIYFAYQWSIAYRYNHAFFDQSLLKMQVQDNAQLALLKATLVMQQKQDAKTIKETLHTLTIAEASPHSLIRAHAKFSFANLYFDLSAISGDIGSGGSHQQAVAQIELAREAYKSVLRLIPNLYDARFNLELLDRLSPEKRTQGWLAETDGVTLQPFKQNGTAMMRDNRRRGLP
jgi:tetratricopeptide (TPR) repeat protein